MSARDRARRAEANRRVALIWRRWMEEAPAAIRRQRRAAKLREARTPQATQEAA